MSKLTTCPTCQAQFEAGEGRLCPKCLLRGARPANRGEHESPIPSAAAGRPAATHTWHQAAAAGPIMKPAQVDELFPELEVLDIVGHGGMGVVYKARQKNLGREVALKLLSSQLMDDPAFAERFSREARAMAKMNHPNIIAIYDFGQRGEHYYLVMEYVDGLNLRQLISGTRLEPAEAMQMVPQLCDALQYAHDRGIVHRDIKPENVMISQEGFIKIADFGLAKMTDSTPGNFTLTQSRQVMGTLNYMAPEQVERPTDVDHRADIYSLGVVIYELLTGELPLGRFSPPSQKSSLDARLDEVVLRALEKEPSLRYQQASEFKTGMQSFADGRKPHPSNAAGGESQLAFRIAYFVWLALAVTLLLGGGLAIAIGYLANLRSTLLLPGTIAAGMGLLLLVLTSLFRRIFSPQQPLPRGQQTRSASQGPGIAVMVAGIVGLLILALLGMKNSGAPIFPGMLGLMEILILAAVGILGFLAIRFLAWQANRPPTQNSPAIRQPGELPPLPNYLIAVKALGMMCFFACPILFIAYGLYHEEELKFAGIVAPIVGACIMAMVGMVAQIKGYHDPEKDKK